MKTMINGKLKMMKIISRTRRRRMPLNKVLSICLIIRFCMTKMEILLENKMSQKG